MTIAMSMAGMKLMKIQNLHEHILLEKQVRQRCKNHGSLGENTGAKSAKLIKVTQWDIVKIGHRNHCYWRNAEK